MGFWGDTKSGFVCMRQGSQLATAEQQSADAVDLSRGWLQGLMRRHEDLLKGCCPREVSPVFFSFSLTLTCSSQLQERCLDSRKIEEWFSKLKDEVEGAHVPAGLQYNFDETFLFDSGHSLKVVTHQDCKPIVHKMKHSKEHITLGVVCAFTLK